MYSRNGSTPHATRAKRAGTVEAMYPYTDELGKALYQVVRLRDPKDFYQRHRGPEGAWVNNIQGVRRVLFKLPDVLAAKREGRVIYLPEGEKDVLTLNALGVTATTNAMGAGKWRSEYTDELAGAHVVVLPDKDAPGRAHRDTVLAAIRGKATSVRVVELPDRNGQAVKDVSDWVAAGGTLADLEALVAQADLEPSSAGHQDAASDLDLDALPECRATDMWNGEALVQLAGRDLRYCPQRDMWLVWQGTHWAWDMVAVLVEERAKVVVKALYGLASRADDKGQRDKLADWAKKSEASARVRDMVHMARSEAQIRVALADLDAQPDLFNVQNGTIDLRTGELRAHRREDLITKCAPVAYDREVDTETWDHFIDDITRGDLDLQLYLAKAVGYALTGHAREDLVFFLYGKGSNGKSTFMGAVAAMMGEYAGTIPAGALVEDRKRSTGHRDEIASLAGARLAIVSECPERMKLDMATLKALSGGDLVSASHKYGRTFQYKPQYTPFLYGNSKPRIVETDEGTWRRVRMVPFLAKFERGKGADEGLRDRLQSEHRAAVLKWAVLGAIDWYRDGMKDAESVADATAQYRDEEDNVGRFLRECCALAGGGRAPQKQLYDAYKAWCTETGENWAGPTSFGTRLQDRGYVKGKSGATRYWKDIALNQDAPVQT
jgi:putative DNA primase/helicase